MSWARIARIRHQHARAVDVTAAMCEHILSALDAHVRTMKATVAAQARRITKALTDHANTMDITATQLHSAAHAGDASLNCSVPSSSRSLAAFPVHWRGFKVPHYAFETICPRTSSVIAPSLYTSMHGAESIDLHVRDDDGELVEWLVHKDIKIIARSLHTVKFRTVRGEAGVFHLRLHVPVAMRIEPLTITVRIKGVVLRAWTLRKAFQFVRSLRIQAPHEMSNAFSVSHDATWLTYGRPACTDIYVAAIEPETYGVTDQVQFAYTGTPTCLVTTPRNTILVCDGTDCARELTRSGNVLREFRYMYDCAQMALSQCGSLAIVGSRSLHVLRYADGAQLYAFRLHVQSPPSSLSFLNSGTELLIAYTDLGVYVTTLSGHTLDKVTDSMDAVVTVLHNDAMLVLDRTRGVMERFLKNRSNSCKHFYGSDQALKNFCFANGMLFVNAHTPYADFIYLYE